MYLGRARVLVRDLGQGTDPSHADSAVLEEAALVVRATLQALMAGAQVGVERSLVEQQSAPRQRTGPSDSVDQRLAAPAPALPGADGVFSIDAGWQIALDGEGEDEIVNSVRCGSVRLVDLAEPEQRYLLARLSLVAALD